MALDGSALVVMNVADNSAPLRDLGISSRPGSQGDPRYEFMDVVRVPTTGGAELVVGDPVRMGGVPIGGSDLLFTSRPYLLGYDRDHPDGPFPPDEIARFSKVGGRVPLRSDENHPYPPMRVTAAFADAEPAFAVSGEDLFFFAALSATTDERLDVMRMPRAGGEATRVTTVDRGARHLFLIADAHDVYFPEPRRLGRAPLTGGKASTVAEVDSIRAAASDGEHVYLSTGPDGGPGSIHRVAVGGGPVETLATGFSSPVALALDATSVWFVDADPENGAVYRVPKGGGRTVAVARGQKQPAAIVVDEAHVYWANKRDGTVCRVDR